MSKEAVLHIRMDADVKEQVEQLYSKMGTTFAEGVRMMAAQSLLIGGIPFSIRAYPTKHRGFGALAKYADPTKISQEDNAIRLAMEEKYANAN